MKKNISFAELYMDRSFFANEANQTIGTPLIGENIEKLVNNRRNVTSKLSKRGTQVLTDILSSLEIAIGMKVVAKWDRYCGCSMCPCSPGFRISATNIDTFGSRNLRGKNRFSIWVGSNGKISTLHTPKDNEINNINFIKNVLSIKK